MAAQAAPQTATLRSGSSSPLSPSRARPSSPRRWRIIARDSRCAARRAPSPQPRAVCRHGRSASHDRRQAGLGVEFFCGEMWCSSRDQITLSHYIKSLDVAPDLDTAERATVIQAAYRGRQSRRGSTDLKDSREKSALAIQRRQRRKSNPDMSMMMAGGIAAWSKWPLGSAAAPCPGLLGRTRQAPGCAPHSRSVRVRDRIRVRHRRGVPIPPRLTTQAAAARATR